MTRFTCFDLETTSTNTDTCEVVQAAVVTVPWSLQCESNTGSGFDWSAESTKCSLFHAARIPLGASEVHGIRTEDVQDKRPFADLARGLVDKVLLGDDTIVVTFNGSLFDVPIVLRHDTYGGTQQEREAAAAKLRARHVDVWRLWTRFRRSNRKAEAHAGTLLGAHLFWCGDTFDGAHDAANDCRATLRVLAEMLVGSGDGFVTLADAIRWSSEPLPGDVDFAGKFSWCGDTVVINFGEHGGKALEDVPTSYLRWMVDKASFPADTVRLVRAYLAGDYPVRRYEDEV